MHHTLVRILIGLALVVFIWRGPWRALGGERLSSDFAVVYGASQAWLSGLDPYDYPTLTTILRQRGYDSSVLPHPMARPSVYPPTTFISLSPLTMAYWGVARVTWLAINLTGLAILVWSLIGSKQSKWADWRVGLLIAAVLMLACVQSGVALGQLALLPVAMAVWALQREKKGRPWGAGLLTGLAAAIKPHVGGVFLIYLLLRPNGQRLKVLATAAVVLAVLGAASITRLDSVGIDWRTGLQRNLKSFTVGGIGDPTPANPLSFQLINLHVPLHLLIDSHTGVNLLVYGLIAVAAAIAFIGTLRSVTPNRDGLLLSILAVLSLMAAPHRHYDAVLLVLPLSWCIQHLGVRRDLWCWAALLSMIPFLTPGGALIFQLSKWLELPNTLTASWWWQCFVVLHQPWALVALAISLIGAMWATKA